VAGATDTAAELVSVGAIEAGSALVKIASTGTVVGVSAKPVVEQRLLTYPHAVPELWYTLAATNTATVAYQWLREVVFASSPALPAATYEEINRLASDVPAGAEGLLFLPFLTGERTPYFDALLRAAFLGLSSAHGREHLARAVLEGVCMSLRDCRDVMREVGFDIRRPFLAGGGMSSELWRSILTSALGVPGVLASPQGPAVGAAILAAAAGADTVAGVLAHIPTVEHRTIEPNLDWVATYDGLHATYRLAAEAVADVSHRLAGAADRSRVRA
jgi:xylulokinase